MIANALVCVWAIACALLFQKKAKAGYRVECFGIAVVATFPTICVFAARVLP